MRLRRSRRASLRLGLHADAAAQKIEGHEVTGAEGADAVERDQGERQGADGVHAWIVRRDLYEAGCNGDDEVREAEEMQGEIAVAALGKQHVGEREKPDQEIAAPRVAHDGVGKQVVCAVPEERQRHCDARDMKDAQGARADGFDIVEEAGGPRVHRDRQEDAQYDKRNDRRRRQRTPIVNNATFGSGAAAAPVLLARFRLSARAVRG